MTAGTTTVAGVGSDHPVGPLTDIPVGEGRCYTVAGDPVAVFRLRNGQVHATQGTCPHRGGPLADGQLDDEVVVCPLHAYAYVLATGRRVGDDSGDSGDSAAQVDGGARGVGAQTGEPEVPGRPATAIRVYPVRVDDSGTVVVTVAG